MLILPPCIKLALILQGYFLCLLYFILLIKYFKIYFY